jgi:hypothetical protein
MLFLDNKLNNAMLDVQVRSAWSCSKIEHSGILEYPGHHQGWYVSAPWSMTAKNKTFSRQPLSSRLIADSWMPQIVGANNWIQKLVTGLEIGIQFKH